MGYVIKNYLKDGTCFDISQLITKTQWGGDIRQSARKLTVDLAFGRDYYLPKYNPPLGSILMLLGDSGELFRGVVFDNQKDTGGQYQVISYDHLIYLLKSKGTYKFGGMTPEAITKKLCSDFNILIGDLPASGVSLDKLWLREKAIYDMILAAWLEAADRNGKKYEIRMIQGKLTVFEKQTQTLRWLITEGQNLISAAYSENINDMKNRIIIMGSDDGEDEVLATVDDPALIAQYGLLQEMQRGGSIQSAEALNIAQNMLKDLGRVSRESNIVCLGIDDVVAGVAIELQETLTGMTGTFYVDTDEHNIEGSQHTMNLKLNWTDDEFTVYWKGKDENQAEFVEPS